MQKCNLCINGKPIENHYIILDGCTQYFQSYDKIIAKFQNDVITVFDGWDTSRTTLKYFCRWLEQILNTSKSINKSNILNWMTSGEIFVFRHNEIEKYKFIKG